MSRGRASAVAALAYLIIATVMTWPLVARAASALPADLGDPAFNCWVMMWTGGQVLAALSGNVGALADYWNGNIFYPSRLTIAYSEHLTPEALQALPFYGLAGNIILGYNIVFLSTFVFAGLGVFLLVREWTSQPLAAFLAGLAYAYAPYRLGQITHLQVLSTYWMAFALYGLRRHFDTGRSRALVGGSAALVLQNLSCGYYMLFFTPFAIAYYLYEIVARRLIRDRRLWAMATSAGLIVAVLCLPFAVPYVRVRDTAPVGVRSYEEIVDLSADTHAFATAPVASRFWAPRLPHPGNSEGEGFPGLTILTFSALGLVWTIRQRIASIDWRRVPVGARALCAATAVVLLVGSVFLISLFANGRVTLPFSGGAAVWRASSAPLQVVAAALALLVLFSTLARRGDSAEKPTGAGFSAIAVMTAALLALGPRVQAAGHRLGDGPYAFLLQHVPGFDGLRVPARFLMIVAMFTAVMAGFGGAWVLRAGRSRPRLARLLLLAGMAAILFESFMAPMVMNQPLAAPGFRSVQSLATGARTPAAYRIVRDWPGPVVLLEMPIGEPAMDIPAVFYAGYHRRPLINGYSGFFPERYLRRSNLLMRATEDPPEAMSMLRESEVTHVLIHESAFTDDRGRRLTDWLRSEGARLLLDDQGDKLFTLRPERAQ